MFNVMQSGQFPAKHAWKRLVCKAVRGQAEREWQCRMSSRVIFDGFSCIKPVLLKPCELLVLGNCIGFLISYVHMLRVLNKLETTS